MLEGLQCITRALIWLAMICWIFAWTLVFGKSKT